TENRETPTAFYVEVGRSLSEGRNPNVLWTPSRHTGTTTRKELMLGILISQRPALMPLFRDVLAAGDERFRLQSATLLVFNVFRGCRQFRVTSTGGFLRKRTV